VRVLPHGEGYANRRTSKLGFHRDNWSSNVYAHSNWWAPIYPITSECTVAFYPEYWQRPLKNTSVAWDLEKIRTGRSVATVVPEPEESVDSASELRLVVEPGDLLYFSGAHLHASVPNTSGLTRFSVEVRTVDSDDVWAGYGAPNLDGEAPHVALSWFHHVADDTSLPAIPAP
jgi:ectoine hydroxylase-related dioxygenase (phytanoyl-CoA dioxygenase family)